MRNLTITLAFIGSALAAVPAQAELIRITPTGLPAAGYEEGGYPVSPVIIGGDGFRLTYHGGGTDPLLNPLMVILGVPDTNPLPISTPMLEFATSQPTFVVNIGFQSSSGIDYNGTWDATTGYAGIFDSTAGSQSVYEKIGFTPRGSDSENYTNWSGATGLGSWDLFVFVLEFAPELMNHGDWVEFKTSLPTGSYVIGYGCTELDENDLCRDQRGKGNNGDTESTPFTFAGRVDRVPEPGTLALLLPALGLLIARKYHTRG